MRCAVKAKSTSDERSAGNRHATFCGSRERVTAPGDPVAVYVFSVRPSLPRPAELGDQKNVHVVLTQPNEVRGNHVHRTAVETTSVVGPCLIRLKEGGTMRDLEVPAGEVWRLTIPPGVVHAFRNTGESVMVLVSFSTNLRDPAGTDMLREQIL